MRLCFVFHQTRTPFHFQFSLQWWQRITTVALILHVFVAHSCRMLVFHFTLVLKILTDSLSKCLVFLFSDHRLLASLLPVMTHMTEIFTITSLRSRSRRMIWPPTNSNLLPDSKKNILCVDKMRPWLWVFQRSLLICRTVRGFDHEYYLDLTKEKALVLIFIISLQEWSFLQQHAAFFRHLCFHVKRSISSWSTSCNL